MIFPTYVRQQQAAHPLCRSIHPTHIGISSSSGSLANRPHGEDTHILIICVSGKGFAGIGGKRHDVPAGHILLIPAGVPHQYGSNVDQSWSIQWLHFSGEYSSAYFDHVAQGIHISALSATAHDNVLQLYQELYRTATSGFEIRNLVYASQVLSHLLGLLFFPPELETGDNTVSARAIKTMNDNISTQITLEDLASDAQLSRAHFSVVFKKETGFSPIDYFNHLKIRRACRLLDDHSYNVGEVGRRVGIENIHYFSRLFSNIMGMSPKAYRKLPIG